MGIVNTKDSTANLKTIESLESSFGRLDVGEIAVRESSWPAGDTVDSDADGLDVLQASEDAVQLDIGGLVWDVANKEIASRSIGRRSRLRSALFCHRLEFAVEPSTMPEGPVNFLDGLLSALLVSEPGEPVSM
jgi:hypothetical protein